MKRFWDVAASVATGAVWSVTLDGRPVRVPGGAALALPTLALAEAVAAEWQAAGGGAGRQTSYAELPLTRLAGTLQERIAPDPEPVALEIARYAQSDLLCYRAARPEALARRQAERWQPWLDWVEATHGAALRVTTGVVHVVQKPAALARLAAAVRAQPVARLAGLGVAVPALGSLVLGLALAERALDADAAAALSLLDEAFQVETWGEDAEAAHRRRHIRAEVALAARFMALAAS